MKQHKCFNREYYFENLKSDLIDNTLNLNFLYATT